jgi:hypothetical protein
MCGTIHAEGHPATRTHSSKPSKTDISLGIELEFLVPDNEPEESTSDFIDPDPDDHRWFLTEQEYRQIDMLRPNYNFAPAEYVHYYLTGLLRHHVDIPLLMAADAEEQNTVANYVRRYQKHHPHSWQGW